MAAVAKEDDLAEDESPEWQECAQGKIDMIYVAELVHRLEVEHRLCLGFPQFIGFLLFAAFQLWALIISGATTTKEEVYAFLTNHLELESLADVKSSAELWNFIKLFSEATKGLHVLSDTYTSNPEQIFLVSGPTEFDQEVVYPPKAHPRIRASFSFSVWVDRSDAPVIRKVVHKPNGDEIVCWKWTVSSFQYGGHDRPADDLSPQIIQATFDKRSMASGQLSLVNLVVDGNSTHAKVIFYLDGIVGGSTNLQSLGFFRPVTDCVGGKLILGRMLRKFTMSDLKYFPRALTPTEINEIFEMGQPLNEIVTASRTQPVQPNVEESLRQVIEQNNHLMATRIDRSEKV